MFPLHPSYLFVTLSAEAAIFMKQNKKSEENIVKQYVPYGYEKRCVSIWILHSLRCWILQSCFSAPLFVFLELKNLRMSDKNNTFVPKFKSNLKFVQLQCKNLYIN